MTETAELARQLTQALSSAFVAHDLGDGRLVIQTPFQFDDGDGFSVVLRLSDDRWRLTDEGGTASHLSMDDVDFTPARLEALVDIADASGFDFSDLVLSRDQSTDPDPFDVADLLQAIAQLGAIRFFSRERVRRLYRDDVTRFVEERVPAANRTLRWHPPTDSKAIYSADALLRPLDPASTPSTLFAVGNAEQAERATISILMHKRWDLDVEPLVVYDRRVANRIGSPRIYHLQDAAGDDSVLPASPGDWLGVERTMRRRGIPVLN